MAITNKESYEIAQKTLQRRRDFVERLKKEYKAKTDTIALFQKDVEKLERDIAAYARGDRQAS